MTARRVRLKFLVQLNPSSREISLPATEEVSFLPMDAVGAFGAHDVSRSKVLGEVGGGYTYFRDGDLLLAKIHPSFENGKGGIVTGLRNGVGFGTTELHVIRARGSPSAAWMGYVVQAEPFVRELSAQMYGVAGQQRFPEEALRDWVVQVPDRRDERRILDWLDRETARIDALIAKKERLIALLEEKRQALISHAVTKGLDATTPAKDSGIGWIGPMNADWNLVRTKFLCRLTTGVRDTQDAEAEAEFPFYVRSPNVLRASTHSFSGEAVLTAGDGEGGVGKVFHHHRAGRFEAHQRVYVFHKFARALPRFYYYYIREHLRRVTLAGTAETTHASLRRPMLVDFPVTLPPLDAQRAIVGKLDEAEEHAETLRGKLESSVSLLRERRQALITAAVTGQLDPSVYMPKPELMAA